MSKSFDIEQKLSDQLSRLKEEFCLHAVKAEFEAEGASFRDLIRLRRLTAQQNIPLYLKIGGVEALRDITDALDLGVDGLIAPMVESPFGVVKFLGAVERVFGHQKFFKSINIAHNIAVKAFPSLPICHLSCSVHLFSKLLNSRMPPTPCNIVAIGITTTIRSYVYNG